jgi:hypothetical protein
VTCEALVLDDALTAAAGQLIRRRCRKHAAGRIGGLLLCAHHIGSLFVYGEIDAEDEEAGFVRRLTIKTDVERIG